MFNGEPVPLRLPVVLVLLRNIPSLRAKRTMAQAMNIHAQRWSILLFGLGCTTIMQAQSLAQQDLLPTIGASWHMRALQSVPSDELPIEPITWPYSGLVGNDLFGASYSVLDPEQVPGNNAFPSADRALRSVPDNDPLPTHTFYDVQSNECLELGSLGPVLSTAFLQPALVSAYPLEMGTPVSGDFCYSSRSVGGVLDYCGTARVSLEAIGTLELNFGVFPNAQLMTTRRAFAVVQNGSDSTIQVTKDWYVAGTPYPLLHISTLTTPDGSVTRSGQILDETSVVGLAEVSRVNSLPVFPNPTTGIVTMAEAGNGTVEVSGVDGRLLSTQRINSTSGNAVVDLSALPDGVYRIVLRDGVTVRSAKVVVAR